MFGRECGKLMNFGKYNKMYTHNLDSQKNPSHKLLCSSCLQIIFHDFNSTMHLTTQEKNSNFLTYTVVYSLFMISSFSWAFSNFSWAFSNFSWVSNRSNFDQILSLQDSFCNRFQFSVENLRFMFFYCLFISQSTSMVNIAYISSVETHKLKRNKNLTPTTYLNISSVISLMLYEKLLIVATLKRDLLFKWAWKIDKKLLFSTRNIQIRFYFVQPRFNLIRFVALFR